MTLTLKANAIIDTLVLQFDYIQECYEKIPRGTFIASMSEYRAIYDKGHQAEQSFYLASDLLGINISVLYKTVLAARRWYLRNGWENRLPDSDADRLLACMIHQHDRENDIYSGKEKGNEYMLFMNRVISDWAKKSIEKKTT